MKSKNVLGARIKSRRKALKMNQEELAHESDSVRQTISAWERGMFLPNQGKLVEIAKVLNTTVGYLIGESDDPTRNEKEEQVQEVPDETKTKAIKQARPARLEDFVRTYDASKNLDSLDDGDLDIILAMLSSAKSTVEKEKALRTAKEDGVNDIHDEKR